LHAFGVDDADNSTHSDVWPLNGRLVTWASHLGDFFVPFLLDGNSWAV